MKRTETRNLLKIIESFIPNFRGDDEQRIEDWHAILGDMSFEEAREHLYAHFRESEYPPKPVDLFRRAAEKEENRVDDLVQLDKSAYFQRVGEQSTFEGKVDIYVELYFDLFANQLTGSPLERDEVRKTLLGFIYEAPEGAGERSFRSGAIVYALKYTRRFLTPDELIQKAWERTEFHLERNRL